MHELKEQIEIAPKSENVFIDPDSATKLLKLNTRNRKPCKANVEQYAKDMSEGNWKDGNANVGIDVTNRITDGQHVLLAIVKSGLGQWVCLKTNLHPDAIYCTDIGKPRKLEDHFKIAGIQGYKNKATMTRVLASLTLKTFKRSSHYKGTPQFLLDFYKENEACINCMWDVYRDSFVIRTIPLELLTRVYIQICLADGGGPNEAARFLVRGLCDGTKHGRMAYQYIETQKKTDKARRDYFPDQAKIVFAAWDHNRRKVKLNCTSKTNCDRTAERFFKNMRPLSSLHLHCQGERLRRKIRLSEFVEPKE